MCCNRRVILSPDQRRAMEFIAEVNRGGYRPSGREINQWRLQPEPKPLRKGRLMEREVPAVPDRRVRKRKGTPTGISAVMDTVLKAQRAADASSRQVPNSIGRALAGLNANRDFSGLFNTGQFAGLGLFDGWEYETIPGKPGRPAIYAADKPPEKFLAHLRRLGWIDRDTRNRYSVTKLGRALLAAEVTAGSDPQDSAVIVLAPEDQNLGYGQVLGRVSTCGDVLVADHYLGVQELMDLLEHTDASRFLVGPKMSRDRVTELSVQIKLSGPSDLGVVRELRRANFHDRYLVGEQKVFTLTASLNGVSKSSMALLMEMTDVAADAIRTYVEELWEQAEPLARGLSQEDLDAEDAEDAEDVMAIPATPERLIREENDRFLHTGCDVRHKKAQAARNCTNGS